MAKEGVTEFQIQAAMEYIYKFEGANGSAYGAIVASGNDANILHYVENNKTLKNGDLILIDSGAEYKNYASDVTRTFPVSENFPKSKKKFMKLSLMYKIVRSLYVPPALHLQRFMNSLVENFQKNLLN